MNSLISTAIVGTGQQHDAQLSTNTAVDALAEQLKDITAERKILLTAGAWATYCRAGATAQPTSAAVLPAPPDTLPVCSAKVALLLAHLLEGKTGTVLPEALTLLKQAGQRLPYAALPAALQQGTRDRLLRRLLISVLGERGHWLSQFNKEWAWVSHFLNESTPLTSEEREKIWHEGTIEQRVEVLQALRSSDPAQARDWLLNVWKQEKADPRVALLATFLTGLSPDDEAFLENALDDRAETVRTEAARLLARLPSSAFSQRMIARADTMLDYTENALQINPPATFEKAWQRDGMVEKPDSSHVGGRAWWFKQVMKRVSPTHWETRFSLSPAQLIAAAEGSEWQQTLLEGWSEGIAELYQLADWALPLWDWWNHTAIRRTHRAASTHSGYTTMLVWFLPQDALEKRSLPLFPPRTETMDALSALSRPWRAEFGRTCLQMAREYIQDKKNFKKNGSAHTAILPIIARCIPPECFDAVEPAWCLPDEADEYSKNQLNDMLEIIHMRKRVLEEIQ